MEAIQTGEHKFWMVWRKDGDLPKHRHPTYEVAYEEAGRLAAQVPHATFYVLEAVTGVRAFTNIQTWNLMPEPSEVTQW